MLVLFAALLPMLIGVLGVLVLATVLRIYLLPDRVNLPLSLVLANVVFVVVFAFFGGLGYGISDIPFDSFSLFYLFVPGTHILQLANAITPNFLFGFFEPAEASFFVIVVSPALFGVVVGSIQWFTIGTMWNKFHGD